MRGSLSKLVLDVGGLLELGLVLVKLHELGEIELGLLEDLDLPDHAVVFEGEDLAALLLDLGADLFFNAGGEKIIKIKLNWKKQAKLTGP